MNTIFCPLFKKEVDAIWCIEITDVANGLIKKRVLPDCKLRIKNFKEYVEIVQIEKMIVMR